ncbi:MAG: DUF1499 domain-containing protein [Paracoccaceae bacterium]|nr:DUF1499 domain-containing protein [Paracoccaceae bacterium]
MKIIFAVFLIVIIVLCYIRFAKPNESNWHVDPELVSRNDLRNSFLINSKSSNFFHYAVPVKELYIELYTILEEDKCQRVFGDIDDGLITFVCRSRLFGFPDYVSISLRESETGVSTLSVFSRSRFGIYDFGKNKKRVTNWLQQLKSNIQDT